MAIDLNIRIDANCEHNIVKAVGGRATAGGKVHDPYLIQELIDFAGPYTSSNYQMGTPEPIPHDIREDAIEYVRSSNKPSSYKVKLEEAIERAAESGRVVTTVTCKVKVEPICAKMTVPRLIQITADVIRQFATVFYKRISKIIESSRHMIKGLSSD